jgi:hypothetical protein
MALQEFTASFEVDRDRTPTDMAGDPWCISATSAPPLLNPDTVRRLSRPRRYCNPSFDKDHGSRRLRALEWEPSESRLSVQVDVKVAACLFAVRPGVVSLGTNSFCFRANTEESICG